MLRREKRDVELTLPKKTETVIEVELTLTQKRWYRAVFERNRNFLMQGPSKKAPSLINVLMQLRKVCNHPFLVTGSREAVYEEHLAVEAAANAAVTANLPSSHTGIDGDSALDTAAAAPLKTEAATVTGATAATGTTGTASATDNTRAQTDTLPPLPRLHIAFPGEDDANIEVRESRRIKVEKKVKEEIEMKEMKERIQEKEGKCAATAESGPEKKSEVASTPTSLELPNTSTVTSTDPLSVDLGSIDSTAPLGDDPALKDPLVYCSGKIVFLHKLLIKLKKEKSKSLIFSQFTTTLDVIQEYLNDYGYPFEVHPYVYTCIHIFISLSSVIGPELH